MIFGTRTLDSGLKVRLRLAQPGDLPELRALLRRADVHVDDLALQRLLLFDPRRRAVICAAAWMNAREALVGIGAIDFGPDATPDLLWAPEPFRAHVADLLHAALLERAASRNGRAA
jgi:hypothetical protein